MPIYILYYIYYTATLGSSENHCFQEIPKLHYNLPQKWNHTNFEKSTKTWCREITQSSSRKQTWSLLAKVSCFIAFCSSFRRCLCLAGFVCLFFVFVSYHETLTDKLNKPTQKETRLSHRANASKKLTNNSKTKRNTMQVCRNLHDGRKLQPTMRFQAVCEFLVQCMFEWLLSCFWFFGAIRGGRGSCFVQTSVTDIIYYIWYIIY